MSHLPRPQQQLSSYFSDLLMDPDADDMVASEDLASTPISEPSKQDTKLMEQPVAKVATKTDVLDQELSVYERQQQKLQKLLSGLPTTTAPVADEAEVSTEKTTVEAMAEAMGVTLNTDIESSWVETPLSSQWLDNGRPCWAQKPFDVLLLKVGGLNLAVPLEALGQIHVMNNELTSLFGQDKWLLGLQKTPNGSVKAVNTAQFIMPERYQPHHKDALKYVVVINGLEWAIAVEDIDQPMLVDPDDIKWRRNRQHQAWMAGTLKDHMCVLVDIPVLGKIFMAKDHNTVEN